MFRHGLCTSKARLDGKVAVITGANTGIGKITAQEFYRIGARVIIACRDLEKAKAAVADIKNCVGDASGLGEIIVKKLDLASLASVKECAKDILLNEPKINILVNNAGIMMCPKSKTEDGFEMQFGVNHLGHFLFTCLLLPRIRNSIPARIVNVSSLAHKTGSIHLNNINLDRGAYTPILAYGQSKLANVLFTKELANNLKDTGVNVYALHPGIVKTELGRHLGTSFFPGVNKLVRLFTYCISKTPEQGAQTTLYCALDESLENETGYYYSDCKRQPVSANADNEETAKELWKLSVQMVKLEGWNPFSADANDLPPMLLQDTK